MRILFVHNALVCGGVEKALLSLCTMLKNTMHDVTVLEYAPYYDSYDDVFKPQYIHSGVRVIAPTYRLKPGKNIFHKVYNVIMQYCIEQRVLKNRVVYIKEEFDLIVYYQITDVMVKCLSKAPYIMYIHGDVCTNEDFFHFVNSQKDRLLQCDKVICVSEIAKDSLKKALGIWHNTVAIHNPIDRSIIVEQAGEKVEDLPRRPYICAVGRLATEKRFGLLIRAHTRLKARGIEHDLVIVGDGPMRSALESLVRETHAEDTVHLLGFRENPYPYIANSMFLAVSSETEGLCIAAMEAICLGKPVVSSAPTVAELFGEEPCGLVTDVEAECFEEGLYHMLTDKVLYEKCRAAAERRKTFFSLECMIEPVERVYQEVIRDAK